MQTQRGLRAGGEFTTLAALEVREKDEATRIKTAQQDDPHRRPTDLVDGGEAHRCRFAQAAVGARGGPPAGKSRQRVIESDAQMSAMAIASAVYHLAMRDDKLPRFTKDAMPARPGTR